MGFTPPDHSIIFRSSHWILNHNLDAKIPGYLMLSPVSDASEFHDLCEDALTEMGPIIAKATKSIRACFEPDYIFTSRYGVTPGFALHFHIIPIYAWIKDMLRDHPRYRCLDSLYNPDFGTTPDAADFTLFVWREFVESKTPLAASGFSFDETVTTLRCEINKKSEQDTATPISRPVYVPFRNFNINPVIDARPR